MEEQKKIVELVDEDGIEISFNHLMTIEYEKEFYIVLMPLGEINEDKSTGERVEEVIILKLEVDEQGEDSYITVEDDEVLDEVFDRFLEMIDDDYFFEGDELVH